MASCTAKDKAVYSASAVDRVTIGCFLLRQLTAAPLLIKTSPDVDLRSFMSPAKSASEKPTSSCGFDFR